MTDSDIDSWYYLMLAAWIVGPAMLFALHSRRNMLPGVILYSYLFGLFMGHWMGALVHGLPGHSFFDSKDTVEGFKLSTYGLLALLLGALLVPTRVYTSRGGCNAAEYNRKLRETAKMCLLLGVLAWLAFYTPVAQLPSASSLLSAGKQCMLLGICLFCWVCWQERRMWQFRMWIALSLLLPVITIVTSGFIGYGITMVGTILVFVAMFYRPRWVILVGLLASIYAGMSLWVVYAASRDEIRGSVWGGQDLSARGDALYKVWDNLGPIDFNNQDQLQHIDNRLNQNSLIGAAIRTTPDLVPFLYGETVLAAVAAIIPRAIWPDKPASGGSGKYASQQTMIEFAEGTSVGLGQVLEFYINYGVPGVIVGFLLLGMALRWIDIGFVNALQNGNIEGCVVFFLLGSGAVQPGGSLSEAVAAVGGGVMLAFLINRYFRYMSRRRAMGRLRKLEGRGRR